ncbi:hypothetical protein CD351_09035 [Erythrobacter sp. KY5]|uniref:hypothetical protein n=1 Tax=Erythrobacter sp. KY5 TaxID=2011159 RepID=UPI000DBF014D|nr:hypothetical protein [Erythrobacter sp. KY5]AWW74568.1 hypothetical protein CD351_09035 [Erythrobacter sp. KY5]
MHNAIKGAGIGIICLCVYFGITSVGSVSLPSDRKASDQSDPVVEEVAVAQTEPAPTTPLEQAIIHAFSGDKQRSPEEQQKWLQSVDYVSASINVKGYLCAAPIESAKVDADHYGIGCITNRDGTGRSNYLVNFRNGNVQPI